MALTRRRKKRESDGRKNKSGDAGVHTRFAAEKGKSMPCYACPSQKQMLLKDQEGANESMSPVTQDHHSQALMQEAVAPAMPFIFHYLTAALPSQLPSCTDPTAGYETKYQTNWDSQSSTDYTDDTDETDADPETGVLADSGSREDEE